jgi:small subunit ribosomal protein S21
MSDRQRPYHGKSAARAASPNSPERTIQTGTLVHQKPGFGITVYRDESFEHALRRFKKQCDLQGVKRDIQRAQERYAKPSERKKKKRNQNRRRREKASKSKP